MANTQPIFREDTYGLDVETYHGWVKKFSQAPVTSELMKLTDDTRRDLLEIMPFLRLHMIVDETSLHANTVETFHQIELQFHRMEGSFEDITNRRLRAALHWLRYAETHLFQSGRTARLEPMLETIPFPSSSFHQTKAAAG